jgi:hypothetical protein
MLFTVLSWYHKIAWHRFILEHLLVTQLIQEIVREQPISVITEAVHWTVSWVRLSSRFTSYLCPTAICWSLESALSVVLFQTQLVDSHVLARGVASWFASSVALYRQGPHLAVLLRVHWSFLWTCDSIHRRLMLKRRSDNSATFFSPCCGLLLHTQAGVGNFKSRRYCKIRRLGGVVVSVLATGPKRCGSKSRPRRWIFKGDKNPQHTFLSDGK